MNDVYIGFKMKLLHSDFWDIILLLCPSFLDASHEPFNFSTTGTLDFFHAFFSLYLPIFVY